MRQLWLLTPDRVWNRAAFKIDIVCVQIYYETDGENMLIKKVEEKNVIMSTLSWDCVSVESFLGLFYMQNIPVYVGTPSPEWML